jgi:hypothetical protein
MAGKAQRKNNKETSDAGQTSVSNMNFRVKIVS